MPHRTPLKNVYISSIYQDAGKTTISLGLFKIFRERRLRPAFLKPVGQQTVSVQGHEIDKDSYLIGSVYRCKSYLRSMSPVAIGHGFTEKYIANPQQENLRKKIRLAYQRLTKNRRSIIVEGTGHAGVGSVIDVSNADVARMLGSKVIIVSEGGIGRSIDEIMLNKALFDNKGVEVLGVIINKVLPEKYERIKQVLSKGLAHKDIPLLGVIPMNPLLRDPTVEHLQQRLDLELLCGKENLHKRVRNTIVAAMEPANMIEHISSGTLVLTSGDRIDNIMVAVSSHLIVQSRRRQVVGMILTGGLMPDEKIMRLLKRSGIPVMITDQETYHLAGKIDHLVCKIQTNDKEKINEARQLVARYVDVDAILQKL
ncbi:MAG: phosphotransacetylase family protein [Candidatus Omnitrophota bacterium]